MNSIFNKFLNFFICLKKRNLPYWPAKAKEVYHDMFQLIATYRPKSLNFFFFFGMFSSVYYIDKLII